MADPGISAKRGGGTPKCQGLYHYLLGYKVERGCEHTHTSFARPTGSFYIPSSERETFMTLYRAALSRGEDLHITERHRHIGPVLVDLDFRFEATADDVPTPVRRYDEAVLLEVARVYAREIALLVEVQDESIDIFVTEKPKATIVKGLVKDGVHLMMPGVVTRPAVQLIARQAALAAMGEAMAPLGLLNRVEDVVDEAVIERNNWLMYGSKKTGGAVAYVVTRLFRYSTVTGKVSVVSSLPPAEDYVELLSIRNKFVETRVREEKSAAVEAFVAHRDELRQRREAVQAVLSSTPNPHNNTCDDIDKVGQLVDLLDIVRTESYNEWVRVGWCLRNIDHRLLDKWVEFSRRSDKYVEGECPRLWKYMRQGGLGMGTLHMWARNDSPDRYRELLRTDLSELVLRSANGTHHDVAVVIHHMYRYDYVCSSITNRRWYEFRDHRWRECDAAYTLRRRISKEVFREYGVLAVQIQTRAIAAADEAEAGRLLEVCQKLNGIALQLKKTHFKKNLVEECSELFHVEKFDDLLDSDMDLLGFENGVYDLQRDEFREGRPDDYISFSTGIHWVPYVDEHPSVKEIKRFWEQIHPDADIRGYVLRTLASCLSGHILHERFNIWTGSGSNGKSLSVTLMEKSFGDYCCKFPVTLLTGKRAVSNAASSEIARAKGRRFAVLQEPSEDEKLNIGLMKELSGGDKIQCRELYKAPVEWRPQFKLFLLCNHLPSVPSEDGGTWRRIRVVEFGSKFVETPARPNEFPIDMELPQKLEGWREHFMAMLLDYHRRYAHSSKVEEPEAVMACTREYQRNNDHMADFIDSCIEPAPEPATVLTLNDAFDEFKDWIKTDNIPVKAPKKREFQQYLDRCLVHSTGSRGNYSFRGFRLRDRYAQAADDDVLFRTCVEAGYN